MLFRSHVKSSRVRPIAVYSAQRSPSMSDVPTVAEAGLPGFEAGTFNVLIGPAALPAPVVQRLNALHNEAMGKPVLRERYLQMGMVTVINTPQQTTDFLTREMAKWAKVIKEAGVKIEG